ncbi:MAG: peptide deformylase [Pseudomonadota bacterium]
MSQISNEPELEAEEPTDAEDAPAASSLPEPSTPEPSSPASPLVLMGHPVLRSVAEAVDLTEPDLGALGHRMIEIMHEAYGVGLAAPQIGLAKRIIVYEVPPARLSDEEEKAPISPRVLINPVIEPVGEAMVDGLEGCLSIPGLRGIVPRHSAVWYRGLDPDGKLIEGLAEGFHARVLQHEVDHLDGVLFLDRMKSMRQLAFDQEAHHLDDMIG